MNFRWLVGVLGAVTTVGWIHVDSLLDGEEYARTLYVEWWADEIQEKATTCREWAEAAERAATIRMSYTAAFGVFSVDMELSTEEQTRIRKLLLSGTVPLALGGPYTGDVMLDGSDYYLEMTDVKGNVKWVNLFALQSRSSLRQIPDYEVFNNYVHAMISEEDKAFLDALRERINQKLKLKD